MRPDRRKMLGILAAALLLTALIGRSAVVVDETRFVLVTEFGRVVTVYGDTPGESGLCWKWPWQSTQEVDRRLQVFDPPTREVITGDKRNLEVSDYVVWRVSNPRQFARSAVTLDAAQ